MSQPAPAIHVASLRKTFKVPVREAGLRAAIKSLVRRQTNEVRAVDDIGPTKLAGGSRNDNAGCETNHERSGTNSVLMRGLAGSCNTITSRFFANGSSSSRCIDDTEPS